MYNAPPPVVPLARLFLNVQLISLRPLDSETIPPPKSLLILPGYLPFWIMMFLNTISVE